MIERKPLTVEEVHEVILETAAQIANQKVSEVNDLFKGFGVTLKNSLASGFIFRADSIRSEKGGLCLSVDEIVTKGMEDEEIAILHAIGVEAIKESIVSTHSEKFVGMILGEAKKHHNYFDRFVDSGTQLSLF